MIKSKPQRYSSHIQLQYLMNKYSVQPQQLRKELDDYFDSAAYDLVKTKNNKVIGLHKKNVVEKQQPVVKETKKPVVVYRKSRKIIRD